MRNQKLNKAINFRSSGKHRESNKLLVQLAREFHDDALINYQCASSFDILGEEAKAVPYYQSAITLGLPAKELKVTYLDLGSSLRSLGIYEQSRITFEEAMDLFPYNRAIQVFYAMTLYNQNDHEKAMEV